MTETKTPTKGTGRRGRKAVVDKDAPHGRDADGKPLAPHGYLDSGKPRVTAKRDVLTLDLGALANPQPVTDELAEVARPQRSRSEQQQMIDDVVFSLHRAWVAAGKPKDWIGENSIPKAQYVMNPEEAETLKILVRKAGDFLKYRIRWGRDLRNNEGKAVIVFGVVDKSFKPRGDKK